jgi:hypothetical protein
MPKEKQKPLTLDQLADYANKVLLPAIDFRIDKKIENLKNELLSKDDEIITKLDKINTENTMRNAQEDREKRFHKIVVKHLEIGSTSAEELSEIKELNVL